MFEMDRRTDQDNKPVERNTDRKASGTYGTGLFDRLTDRRTDRQTDRPTKGQDGNRKNYSCQAHKNAKRMQQK